MDDGVCLRAVPPKNLNGDARQHRCSDSVEIRVDAAHARTRSKIGDSKSTIIADLVAPFKLKCAEHMRIKGSIHCHDYDEDVFPCVQF